MKTLIALAVIAAGLVTPDSPEIQLDTKFEADDSLADQLIEQGLAKLAADEPPIDAKKQPVPTPKPEKLVKARVLFDCEYGKANDVIDIAKSDVKSAEASGHVDTTEASVAYALTLPQNAQPTAQ